MIGIFDSGIGGLTVVRAIMEKLPGYDLIYFGDTARTPYGNKSPETVVRYSIQNTRFLIEKGATLIIIACNTASSVSTDVLLNTFHMPIFEVITPAVEAAIRESKTCRIGVIGTRATINSGIYKKKIVEQRSDATVYSYPCPLLVPLVEEGWLKKPETRMIVKKYLHPLKLRKIDTLILGCTHYPVLKAIIQHKIGKHVRLIDSSLEASQQVYDFLHYHPKIDEAIPRTDTVHFFVSDKTPQFETIAQSIIRKKIQFNIVRF